MTTEEPAARPDAHTKEPPRFIEVPHILPLSAQEWREAILSTVQRKI